MEALGQGLASLGDAIGFVCIAGIAASTFLIYTGKATLEQLKDLFNKDRRYR